MEPDFLRALLDPLVKSCRSGWLETDPVGIVHEARSRPDRELIGLVAASLSLGRVASIRARLRDLVARLDGSPAAVCASESPARLARRLQGFRHRFYAAPDLVILCANAGRILSRHGDLESSWRAGAAFEDAADAFAAEMARPVPGQRPVSRLPLVVSPRGGSTCKRLAMYLRWMVRRADGVDLGLWTRLAPSELVVPLDVHLFRIARLLGLTRRRTANWAAVREVTAALARLDPADPVKYDFAISRLGIVQGCRGRWHAGICPGCPVAPACTAARSRVGGKGARLVPPRSGDAVSMRTTRSVS